MANEREVRYDVKIKTDGAVDAAKRLQEQIAAEAQRIARSEAQASTAKLQAEQAALRVKQAEQRLTTETARAQTAAATTANKAALESLRIQHEEARLSAATIRAEQAAAAAKVKAEQDALRLKQQQAQVAAAEARQANSLSSGGYLGGLGRMLGRGLAAVGLGLGVREISQAAVSMATLNTQLLRTRQGFAVLSGSAEEAERRLKGIKTAAGSAINDLDAMTLANRLVALNMAGSTAEMSKAIETGRRISAVMGGDVVSALENLALAAANQSFVRLDTMGISAQAVRDRMKELREETKNLSAEQAFLQAAMDVANKTFAEVNLDAAISGTERMASAVENLRAALAGGWIGEGTNALLNMAAIGVNAVSGQTTTANRQFFEATLRDVRTLHSAENQAPLARAGRAMGLGDFSSDYLAAGELLNTAFQKLDQAVMAGIPGLEAYEQQLSALANQWAVFDNTLEGEEETIQNTSKALAQLTDEGSAYNKTLQLLEESQTANTKAGDAMLDRAVALDVALATGKLTVADYTALVDDMSRSLVTAAAQAGVTSEAMRKAVNDADLWVRTGGGAGAGMAPLTQNQKETFDRIRGVRPQGSFIPEEESAWSDPSALWSGMLDTQKQLQQDQARAQEQAAKEWERTAERTAKEMEAAAKSMAAEFESRLGKIEGLFGTSPVTSEDMNLAAAGVYAEKPDEWLRQLADEVLNGVDRPDVDIGDAKARAGIGAGVDDKTALAIVQSMWADSSLFAGGRNLDLINQDAVRAHLARQDASASGREAIIAMLGGNAPQEAKAAAALGDASAPDLRSVDATAAFDLEQVANTLKSQITSEDVAGKLSGSMREAGDALAGSLHAGFLTGIAGRDWGGEVIRAVSASVTATALQNINEALLD